LEHELEQELTATREQLHYTIDAHRIQFDRDIRLAHKRLKQSIPRFMSESDPLAALSAPIIYSLIVPIALLDLCITAYQRICFPAYGIACVRRSAYIVLDRHHLAYLNAIEKLNCMYCSYANGVFAYVREVAGRTEQYWCPIRHAKRVIAPHVHYREFVEYGNAGQYKQMLPMLRDQLRDDKGKQ
jgi:hypothetical protein